MLVKLYFIFNILIGLRGQTSANVSTGTGIKNSKAAKTASLGSLEASQLAVNSFVFILAAPRNCLEALSDLPTSVSKNMAALWIRAVFHDAGTWDPANSAQKGGADASLLSFLDVPDNLGLAESIAPRFQQNPNVEMTKADQIGLAGLVSVRHCGGPSMPFSPGRADAVAGKITPPFGRVPLGNATLASFKERAAAMGWTNEDIVALVTGSHTMGGVHRTNSPSITKEPFIPFDDTPGIFDNHVFQVTLQGHCPVPMDCEIAKDPVLRPIVERFAQDQEAFFKQYSISFQKLLSQSSSKLGPPQSLDIPDHVGLYTAVQPPFNFPGIKVASNANSSTSTSSTNSAGIVSRSLITAYILVLAAFAAML